jgi:hypothetical protein
MTNSSAPWVHLNATADSCQVCSVIAIVRYQSEVGIGYGGHQLRLFVRSVLLGLSPTSPTQLHNYESHKCRTLNRTKAGLQSTQEWRPGTLTIGRYDIVRDTIQYRKDVLWHPVRINPVVTIHVVDPTPIICQSAQSCVSQDSAALLHSLRQTRPAPIQFLSFTLRRQKLQIVVVVVFFFTDLLSRIAAAAKAAVAAGLNIAVAEQESSFALVFVAAV